MKVRVWIVGMIILVIGTIAMVIGFKMEMMKLMLIADVVQIFGLFLAIVDRT